MGLGGFFASLILLFFGVRWIGTTNMTGRIQKVYETGPEYRLEFAEDGGDTHVLGNQNLAFPYFKTDADDLHAELNRMAYDGDIVELEVWGYRGSWLGFFPNVIDAERVETLKERRRRRAEKIADSVIATLKNQGALRDGVDVRERIIEAVERAQVSKGAK